MIPNTMIESHNLNEVSNLLLEGRKKDILKKYGKDKKTKKVINYFSENDPSGNNKYLEWMVKVYLGVGKHEGGHTDENISYIVELFHKNLQRIKNKDINSYTFGELAEVALKAEEKRKAKEAEKEVKKEKTVIYEDDNWLVVSPHSWKASCYYGAGTKWCVTSKDTSSHWERYSRNASFFYVINKKLKKKNPLYKVAYRIIGRKGRYELWDAEDLEMSRQDRGKKWLRKLPPEIIEKAELYHEEKYPVSDERPDWIDDDDRAQALVNFKDSYDIESADDWYYGMPIYEIDGEFWVVGDSDEMREAIYEKYDEYGDDELVEYYDHEGYYFEMSDEDSFIENEVDNYIDDLSDEEILAITGYDGKKEDIEASIEELRDQISDSEDEDEIDELEADLSDYESELDSVLDDAKEELYENYSDQWKECLSDGPVECLVNEKGWFSNAWELWKSDMVSLKRYDLLEDITSDADYDEIAWYDSWDEDSDDEGYNWILFQIDY
jgi:hypothetical protein